MSDLDKLNHRQRRLLVKLALFKKQGATIAELAEKTGLPPNGMLQSLGALLVRGWVYQRPTENDRWFRTEKSLPPIRHRPRRLSLVFRLVLQAVIAARGPGITAEEVAEQTKFELPRVKVIMRRLARYHCIWRPVANVPKWKYRDPTTDHY